MKKIITFSFVAFVASFFLLSFNFSENPPVKPGDDLELGFPEDVQMILETSCFDCHTADSKNTKAKAKLNFSKWNNYSDSKKVGKLDKICEEVIEGKMPTKKYLEHYPDRALTKEQVDIVCKWVETTSNDLMGE